MKAYEISLRSGVVRVHSDEVKELIETLSGLEQAPGLRRYSSGDEGYLDYEAAKAILRPKFGDDERGFARRFGRLWMTITRLAAFGEIAFDACCKFCGVRLVEHGAGSRGCMSGDEKSVMVVSTSSLRRYMRQFSGELPPHYRVGKQMRQDYAYLVEHLPAE